MEHQHTTLPEEKEQTQGYRSGEWAALPYQSSSATSLLDTSSYCHDSQPNQKSEEGRPILKKLTLVFNRIDDMLVDRGITYAKIRGMNVQECNGLIDDLTNKGDSKNWGVRAPRRTEMLAFLAERVGFDAEFVKAIRKKRKSNQSLASNRRRLTKEAEEGGQKLEFLLRDLPLLTKVNMEQDFKLFGISIDKIRASKDPREVDRLTRSYILNPMGQVVRGWVRLLERYLYHYLGKDRNFIREMEKIRLESMKRDGIPEVDTIVDHYRHHNNSQVQDHSHLPDHSQHSQHPRQSVGSQPVRAINEPPLISDIGSSVASTAFAPPDYMTHPIEFHQLKDTYKDLPFTKMVSNAPIFFDGSVQEGAPSTNTPTHHDSGYVPQTAFPDNLFGMPDPNALPLPNGLEPLPSSTFEDPNQVYWQQYHTDNPVDQGRDRSYLWK